MDNRLAKMRKERGWSQEQLSKKLGVSRQTVISIEKAISTLHFHWPSAWRTYSIQPSKTYFGLETCLAL